MTMPAPLRTPAGSRPLLALIALVVMLITVPAAAASETQSLTDSGDKSLYYQCVDSSGGFTPISKAYLSFKDITQYPGLWTVYTKTVPTSVSYAMLQTSPNYYEPVTLKIGSTVVGTGYAGYNTFFDNTPGHTPTGIQIWLDIDTWDIKTYTGKQTVTITPEEGTLFNGVSTLLVDTDVTNDFPVLFQLRAGKCYSGDYIVQASYYWENWITDTGTRCILNRTIDGVYYQSDFELQYGTTSITDDKTESLSVPYISPGNWTVINPYGRVYSGALGGSDPDTPTSPTTTVYVRNSQTGALLADAHIEIQDTTTDPWTEVINQTLPSGQVTISLPKDSGIHLTQYHIGATVPGYQQVVPSLFFRVTGPTNVIVEMEPTTGGTEDENNTFLEFYVRDISANAIANANVQVDGQLRWTNAQGYTQFEVPKNASYPYSVIKTGYLTIEGIARVESNDRYVVNVALMAGAVPTQPTVSPTITVEPTPTQTTPIQEDNLIALSVRGLAKGFGIDYDTALLMFGLMIIFGAGGMVMSSVKGGAMEFIAGSIVGTFVAFALGLIPIWIFIIIAVVFGAYVLRVFVQGGQ